MQRPPDAITDIIPPREGEFRIQLPAFEGPLDLLLHLCKKHELDILDLPVSFVTERYLEYLKLMQDLDLDVAAEYLLMAATLAHIKSKMLLPRTPVEQQDDGELGEVTDPRADLIRRLLEYQKYKNAAESLGARAITGRDVFPRGSTAAEAEGPAPLADIGMFKLLDAFEAILKRTKDRSAFEVTSERISIQERMTQISDLLRERGSCTFEELFEKDVSRYEVVITFLALLEMTKMRLTRIHQAEYGAAIHVQHALLDASAPTIPPEREGATTEGGPPRAPVSMAQPLAAAAAVGSLAIDEDLDAEIDAEALEALAKAEAEALEAEAEAELENVTETLEAAAEALGAEAETREADAGAAALEAVAGELEAEAGELEAEASELEAEASELEAETGVLDSSAGVLETQVDVLQAQAGVLDAEAGVLDAVADVLKADADALKAEAGVLEANAEASAEEEASSEAEDAEDDDDDDDDFDDDEDDEEDESAS
jgi:segregation and condensation protein A